MLQLFFASNWGFERGPSFNGPIWSVSVEVLLYALFFIACSTRFNRWWHLLLYICVGNLLPRLNLFEVSQGVFSFFVGGLSYKIFLHLWRRGLPRFHLICLILLTALMWMVIPFNLDHNALYELHRASPWRDSLMIHHKDVVGYCLIELNQYFCEVILFPLTILTLAVCEAFRGTLGKRVAFLGNISYSVYLIHFPLQLLFMLGAFAFAIPRETFYSPWVLLAFFCVLILLGLCSYEFFERPAQKLLRAKLL